MRRKLEKVLVALHCNFTPPDAAPVLLPSNYTRTIRSLKSASLSIMFVLLIPHVTLWPWSLTLWPWMFVDAAVTWSNSMPNFIAKWSNPRRTYCDFNIWPDLVSHVELRSAWDNFHQVRTWSIHPFLIYNILLLIRYVTLWPDPLSWTFALCSTSDVTWSKSVPNLSKNRTIGGWLIDD